MKTGVAFNEKISNVRLHGEDAYPYVNDNVVAVADGLGGRGPERYRNVKTGEIYTSAYIGANTVIEAVQSIPQDELSTGSLKNAIIEKLDHSFENFEKINEGISSSMFKIFPSTLALGYIDEDENMLHAYWCGDSRVYVLDSKKGLIQVSKDDLLDEKLDPLTNIVENGQMSQYVSRSSDFAINESIYQLGHENTIVFAASDGVFDYFQSPMHLEMFLLKTLQESSGFEEFITNMQRGLVEVSGDDISAALMFVGADIYENWKGSTKERFEILENELNPLEEKKKLLDENAKTLDEINKEINRLYESIISLEIPQIVRKILNKELTKEQETKLRDGVLPVTLIQKLEHHISEVKKKNDQIKALEDTVMSAMVKDHLLSQEQAKIRMWEKHRYKKLLDERSEVKSNFKDIAESLTSINKELTRNINIIARDLIQEKPVGEESIDNMKKIIHEFMTTMYQGAAFNKLARRREKCEKAINKLCMGIIEKNKFMYRNFLFGDDPLPFALNDETKTLVDLFRSENNILCERQQYLERELSEGLMSVTSYETISILCNGVDFSKINELQEKELKYSQTSVIYENEIDTFLKKAWDGYRKSYEHYNQMAEN